MNNVKFLMFAFSIFHFIHDHNKKMSAQNSPSAERGRYTWRVRGGGKGRIFEDIESFFFKQPHLWPTRFFIIWPFSICPPPESRFLKNCSHVQKILTSGFWQAIFIWLPPKGVNHLPWKSLFHFDKISKIWPPFLGKKVNTKHVLK